MEGYIAHCISATLQDQLTILRSLLYLWRIQAGDLNFCAFHPFFCLNRLIYDWCFHRTEFLFFLICCFVNSLDQLDYFFFDRFLRCLMRSEARDVCRCEWSFSFNWTKKKKTKLCQVQRRYLSSWIWLIMACPASPHGLHTSSLNSLQPANSWHFSFYSLLLTPLTPSSLHCLLHSFPILFSTFSLLLRRVNLLLPAIFLRFSAVYTGLGFHARVLHREESLLCCLIPERNWNRDRRIYEDEGFYVFVFLLSSSLSTSLLTNSPHTCSPLCRS